MKQWGGAVWMLCCCEWVNNLNNGPFLLFIWFGRNGLGRLRFRRLAPRSTIDNQLPWSDLKRLQRARVLPATSMAIDKGTMSVTSSSLKRCYCLLKTSAPFFLTLLHFHCSFLQTTQNTTLPTCTLTTNLLSLTTTVHSIIYTSASTTATLFHTPINVMIINCKKNKNRISWMSTSLIWKLYRTLHNSNHLNYTQNIYRFIHQ